MIFVSPCLFKVFWLIHVCRRSSVCHAVLRTAKRYTDAGEAGEC
jgi:hypothetical protein